MMIEGERRFADEGVTAWLAGLNPDVLDYIRRSDLADRLGKERMFPNARAGFRRYLDPSVTKQTMDAQETSKSMDD